MWKTCGLWADKKPVKQRLIDFGFKLKDQYYFYCTPILGGTFNLNFYVFLNGESGVEIIDTATQEEYSLAYLKDYVGAFIGSVRAELERVVKDIVNACFERAYQSVDLKEVLAFARQSFGSIPEYLWEDTPDCFILRDGNSKKWYAVFLVVEKRKLGIDEEGLLEIINLKATPTEVQATVDNKRYFPAFHMNKKHWYTLPLDGRVGIEEILKNLKTSFSLVAKNNPS